MLAKKPLLTFDRLVVLGGILLALCVAFGPLARDLYARSAWKEIRCHRFIENGAPTERFFFQWNDKPFYCSRPNMWWKPLTDAHPAAYNFVMPEPNDHCFVNGDDPPIAVYRLDTWAHLGEGNGYYAGGILIVAAVIVYSVVVSRKKRAATPAKAVMPPSPVAPK